MSKYIQTQLENKLKDLIKFVKQEDITVYAAGGCLTSLATNSTINDYDLYFENKEAAAKLVDYFVEDNYHCAFVSGKSITFQKGDGFGEVNQYQIIYYDYYETACDIFNSFDFTINMGAFNLNTLEVTLDKNFMLHNSQRFLKFNTGTKFPLISALRIKKYEERGYSISRKEFMTLLVTINKLNINTWQEFKDQCGELYGMNYLAEIDTDSEFSLEKGLDAISTCEFKHNQPSPSFDVDTLIYRVLGEIDYCVLSDGTEETGVGLDYEEALELGLTMNKVSVKSMVGDTLYKSHRNWKNKEYITKKYAEDFYGFKEEDSVNYVEKDVVSISGSFITLK